jgi:ankyrin repeat protein
MKHHWLTLLCSISLIIAASGQDTPNPPEISMREAITSGNADALRQLLAAGADPQTVEPVPGQIVVIGPQGRYPTIALCLHSGQPHLIPLLLDAGANPESVVSGFWSCTTVVHMAAHRGQVEALGYLIAAGADVNPGPAEPCSTTTPLVSAIQGEQLESARFLLENGADPTAVHPVDPFLGIGMMKPIFHAAQVGSAEIMDLLIEYGAPVEGVRIPEEMRPFFNRKFLELLLDYGAVLDETSLFDLLTGTNSLGFSGPNPSVDPEELEWLLNNGISVDGTLEDFSTILHFAIQRSLPLPVVQVLVEAGADINAVTLGGETPLTTALRRNRTDVADYLEEAGAVESDLPGYSEAIAEDNVAALAFYLEQGMSPDYIPPEPGEWWPGLPTLYPVTVTALRENAMECARLLVAKGADVNLGFNSFTLGGVVSPMIVMVAENNVSGVQFLLDHGAGPDHHLNTPLHSAALYDSPEVAGQLVSADAMAALNAFGETPLDVATGETHDLLQAQQAPAGHGISLWDAIRTGNLELLKAYHANGMALYLAEPVSEGNDQNLTPLLQAVHSRQAAVALYLIERHGNIFAESSLMEKARESQLSEVEELLQTLFRIRLQARTSQEGVPHLDIDYAGFDDSARYHLESSSNLQSWTGVEGTAHSFRDSTERRFTLDISGHIENRQFFRLQKMED